MKVIHLHRQPRPGAFSIENLFHTVAAELRLRGEMVVDYEVGRRSQFFLDLIALWRLEADVYHITGDVNYWVFFLPRRRTVLTVHDIGHYLFSLKGWKRFLYKWIWLVGPMRLASRTTVVSASTRDHIVNYLRIPAQNLKAIENCHNPMYRPVPKPFNAESPRILQVGTRSYKNVPRLIYALRDIPCLLVLIGELDAEIHSALADTGVAWENHVNITQEALYQQYVAADLVTFVSVGEGFGVPIIEAQAMGRPLITANVSPMSDAAGDGACLADPLDIGAIRLGLIKLISDAEFRGAVIEAGLRNVARYSPSVVAGHYLDVYREIVNA